MRQKGNIINCFLLLSCAAIVSIYPGSSGIRLCLVCHSILTLLQGRGKQRGSGEKPVGLSNNHPSA